MAAESTPLWLFVAIGGGSALLLLLSVVVLKSRPFRDGEVFTASRLTRGNRLFPTQVAIGPASVVQHKARWIGREEQSIHIAHVASVTIQTGALFSNVVIETSGGSEPIVCHGHSKADAVRMKEKIEELQTQGLRPSMRPAPDGVGPQTR